MLKTIIIICLTSVFFSPSFLNAFEVAPRISDREIVERLTRLEEGQKNIEKRFDDLTNSVNKRFDDVNKRFDDVNRRFDDVNKRFDVLQWMFGIFITVTIVIMGFVLRMQWQMQKRQTVMETTLETQREELSFIKGLIEKILPPKGAL